LSLFFKLERQFNSEHDVIYMLSTTPNSWLVSKRDFCNLRRSKFISPDEYVVVERWTDHILAPDRSAESIVRAKTMEAAVSIRRGKNNGVEVTSINCINLGGWISDSLVSWTMKSTPDLQFEETQLAYDMYVKEMTK